MASESILTLTDLLLHLRQRLIDAQTGHDESILLQLLGTFNLLLEAAWEREDTTHAALLEDFIDVIGDTLNNEAWKSTIPTIEVIEQAANGTS